MNQEKLSKWGYGGYVLAAFAVAVSLATGCGSDDGDGDGSAATNAQSNGQTGQSANQATDGEAGGDEGGGGGSADDVNGRSPAFIAEADSICREARTQYRQDINRYLNADVEGQGAEEQVLEDMVKEVTVPGIEGQIETLQALSGSPRDEEAIDELTAKFEQLREAVEADPGTFGEGAVQELTDAKETGRILGFQYCGLLG